MNLRRRAGVEVRQRGEHVMYAVIVGEWGEGMQADTVISIYIRIYTLTTSLSYLISNI